jgi:hypothetical protein
MVEKLRAAYELVFLSGPPPVEEPGSCLAAARQADAVLAAMSASVSGDRAIGKAIKRLPIPALGAIAVVE